MSTSDLIDLSALIDDATCFEPIRHHRWPDGVVCPSCARATVVRNGRDDTPYERRRYVCESCGVRFDDLTGTILAGHRQPLRVWVLCLSFMKPNLSNLRIAKELGLDASDVRIMTSQLREGSTAKAPRIELFGKVEADEVYVVAGHEGNPDAVRKQPSRPARKARRRARTRHARKGEAAHPRPDRARRAGRDAHAPLRATLIAKGMIWSPAYGLTDFTVPLFDEFIGRGMP